jgi:hypothetical protein
MFNIISLQTEDIPLIWKFVSLTPIFKTGSPSNPANYCPPPTCIASKLKKVGIKDTLLSQMYISGLLNNNSKHGFLKNKLTATHLLECCLDWNVALIMSPKAVNTIYLIFRQSFRLSSSQQTYCQVNLFCC